MFNKTHSRLLPELKQIESIIENDQQHFLTVEIISQVEHKQQQLPIHALSIGKQTADTPCIAFVGGIHGLERIGTQVVLNFLETLLMRLQWDQVFDNILNNLRIVFLPLINPVGMINHTRSNGQGVDLMRNAPVECEEKAVWLGGGHRYSPKLPWYRGKADSPMENEAQSLCHYIRNKVLTAPFSLVLDCHSGFGLHNQIWFPYAKSRINPIKHIGEIYYLRELFFQTYPYQNYRFEPQSLHYLTHGDLWDYLYQDSLKQENIFLPLTLEMGSWRWVRKNPLQLRHSLGLFHPMKPHRINRVFRGHLILMEFLLHATHSYKKWLPECHQQNMAEQAMKRWYHHDL